MQTLPPEMSRSRLVQQSAHSGVLFALRFLSRLLLAIALGKSLSTAVYGSYSLIALMLALAAAILQLGAHQYFMREIPGRPREEAVGIFWSVVAVELVVMTGLVAVALIVPQAARLLMSLLGSPGPFRLLYLWAAMLLLDTLAIEFARYLTCRAEIEKSNIVTFMQTAAWALLVYVLFVAVPSLVTLSAVLGLWVAALACAVLYGWKSVGFPASGSLRPSLYLAAVAFGFPFMFTNIASLVLDWSDRYFIVSYHSTSHLGVYSYHYSLIMMVAAIAPPLVANVIDPHIVAAHNVGDVERSYRLLGTSLRYQLILVTPLLLVLAGWGHEIVSLMASAQFAAAPWLAAALAPVPVLIVLSNMLSRALFLERRTRPIGACYLIAAGATLGFNLAFIPRHPYYGAAIASDLGFVVLVWLLWHQVRTAWPAFTRAVRPVAGAAGVASVVPLLAAVLRAPADPTLMTATGALATCAVFGAGSIVFGAVGREELRMLVRGVRSRA